MEAEEMMTCALVELPFPNIHIRINSISIASSLSQWLRKICWTGTPEVGFWISLRISLFLPMDSNDPVSAYSKTSLSHTPATTKKINSLPTSNVAFEGYLSSIGDSDISGIVRDAQYHQPKFCVERRMALMAYDASNIVHSAGNCTPSPPRKQICLCPPRPSRLQRSLGP